MYDLYDEKTRERFKELDKGGNSGLQDFKKLQEASKGFK
jgi:hypothetical protein